MHSCKEVARAVSSDELSELPLGRRLLIRWHLFMCRDCMRYSRQIEAIGRAMRGFALERDPRDRDIALGLDIDCEEDVGNPRGNAADFAEPDRLQLLEDAILDELVGGIGEQHRPPDVPGA